ncbi:MAG: hypothetical protein ABIN68_00535 [Sphingomicrobium sp.]
MRVFAALFLALAGCASVPVAAPRGDYLLVWAADVGAKTSDFLAVIDADARSPRYGEVVATAPTGVANSFAHHTEHEMPAGSMLFANGFGAGQTFRFDLTDPLNPKLAGSFGAAGEFMHPHSFARTPSGNLLATYQMRGHDNAEAGALVELSAAGDILRISAAADPAVEPFIRPYSLVVVPALDRVVTTSADMHGKAVSRAVQLWRLSDLKLLKTIRLAPGPRGQENEDPAEARVLADGRTVVVSSFNCGMFLLNGLEGPMPTAEFIHAFSGGGECALPVVAGRYWVATDTKAGLISLDMTNPRKPVEVSRLVLPGGQGPHWISLAPDGRRIVISGGKIAFETRILIARIDPASGRLSLDESFRDKGSSTPGVSFDRASWPHGATGKAMPHGAVFSRPSN